MESEIAKKYRWRAGCYVVEKPLCMGFTIHRHGPTKEDAEKELRNAVKGFYYAATDRIEFRDNH